MQNRQREEQRLFLFNTNHEPFVQGEISDLPTVITVNRAIRQYVFLMLAIALPMIVAISFLTSLAGHRIVLLLPVLLGVALLTCAYFVLRGYWRDKVLLNTGKLVFGEVLRQEILPVYANIGTSTITRIIYRFNTPENERKISSIDLAHVNLRMPDGRKYPITGTAIAVFYANEKNYKLL